jgi:hypothetical protein
MENEKQEGIKRRRKIRKGKMDGGGKQVMRSGRREPRRPEERGKRRRT